MLRRKCEVLNGLEPVVETALLQFLVNLGSSQNSARFSLELSFKCRNTLCALPKRDVATIVVFAEMGRNDCRLSGPLLRYDGEGCEAILAFGVKLFGELDPRVPPP